MAFSKETRRQTSPECFRLMIDEHPAGGAWQMAVDEVLLQSAVDGGTASLRFYRWAEPTLSLGYFQRYDDRAAHVASADCPLVRRQTGGGAIVHDHELTYSLVVPASHPLAGRSESLYEAAHEALIRALAAFGLATHRHDSRPARALSDEPFLCFQRRAAGDVLIGDTKVCGSAQRRLRGAILQHGSLLLARSARAPELPGVFDLTGSIASVASLLEAWKSELTSAMGLVWERGGLSSAEVEAAKSLEGQKYAAAQWNRRR